MKDRSNRKLWNLVTLLFSILLCLIIGELAARFVAKANRAKMSLRDPPCIIDTEFERRYVPNWSGMCLACGKKYKAQTNSLGLRERELSFDKDDKFYKLLFLGDSITFGVGVEVDATFVRLVEKLLNSSKDFADKRSKTINAGVAGAGTIHEISLLRDIGIRYHPDIVVLNFFLNDIILISPEDVQEVKDSWERVYFKHKIPVSLKNFLARSELFNLLKTGYRNLFIKMGFIDVPRTDWGFWGSSLKDGYYDKFREYIKEIKELGDKEGFKLVIVCFPNYFQVEAKFPDNIPQQRLSAIAQAEDVPFLDLLPVLKDKRKATTLYLDWAHLSPEGHQFVAEKMYQFLRDREVI